MDRTHATGIDVWSSQRWRDRVVHWLDERLAVAGVTRTGVVEQPHLRPWATVLTAPTTAGPVWLKATAPATAFEVGIYQLLREARPAHVLAPIATDLDQGWILLPDGGTHLGEQEIELLDALEVALPQYGQLQRQLTPYVDHLLALGVADMRAGVMVSRFDEALEATTDYVQWHGTPTDREVIRRVALSSSTFASWCEQLVEAPVAASLDHNDLHPWNIFWDSGGARFYDWGDSVVAHPFASMLVGLGAVQAHVLKVPVGDPKVLRLRDAYLEAFTDIAPRAELVETLELACRVAKIARTLTWDRAVRALGPKQVCDDWACAPLEIMASFLDSCRVGAA